MSDPLPPNISIVIPSFNASDSLERTLDAIFALQTPEVSVEVIVSDDGSADGTVELAMSYSGVSVVQGERSGPGGARNRGAAAATGDILVFVDCEDTVLPGWLQQIVEAFESKAVGFANWPATIIDGQRGSRNVWHPARHGPNEADLLPGSFALRRSLFQGVGGYDPVLRMGENSDLVRRSFGRCDELGLSVKRSTEMTIEITLGQPPSYYDIHRLEAMEHLLQRDAADYADDPAQRAKAHAIAAVNAARCEQWGRARRHAWRSARAQPLEPRSAALLIGTLCPPVGRRRWAADGRRSRWSTPD